MKYNKKQLLELEKQLSHPHGKNGIDVANTMFESNYTMILNSYQALTLQDNDTLLEIGHGNGAHLPMVLQLAKGIIFYGLEVSKTMYQEAKRLHFSKEKENQINFSLYKGNKIPYKKDSISKIVTVNTIYFWKNPKDFMKEIARVLKPNGTCIITFADESFMRKLPFVNNSFTLYNANAIKTLVLHTELTLKSIVNKQETVKSKTGDLVVRNYHIAIVKKVLS